MGKSAIHGHVQKLFVCLPEGTDLAAEKNGLISELAVMPQPKIPGKHTHWVGSSGGKQIIDTT